MTAAMTTASRPARAKTGSSRTANRIGWSHDHRQKTIHLFRAHCAHTRRDDTGLGIGTAAKSPSLKITDRHSCQAIVNLSICYRKAFHTSASRKLLY